MAQVEFYRIKGVILCHSVDEKPEDRRFPMHLHDNFELYCFVCGRADYMVEGQIYNLRPGSLMLMRSSETHKLIPCGHERYERYTLNFYPEILSQIDPEGRLLDPFLKRELGQRNLYPAEEFPEISPLACFRKMCSECQALGAEYTLRGNLLGFLSAVNLAYQTHSSPYEEEKADFDRSLLHFVNDHLTEDLTLERISEQMHMSPSQINRIFHRLTGTTAYRYVLSKRLILAQEMMAKGAGAVAASQSCGFHDYSAFYRLYKKRFGSSPTEIIREIEKTP